jgi:pYEATS domain-containing protein involved in immunity
MTRAGQLEIGPEYSIALRVRDAPPWTKSVAYELHDESFDEPRFRVNDAEQDFEAWISSYGDVPISARGSAGTRWWRTKEMLGRALRRGHGPRARGEIKKAIATIERY